jgi:hypothetical protein
MLTTLGFRYAPGREPAVVAGIRQYLGGWPGIGRIIAGMARQQYDLRDPDRLYDRALVGTWSGDHRAPP